MTTHYLPSIYSEILESTSLSSTAASIRLALLADDLVQQ